MELRVFFKLSDSKFDLFKFFKNGTGGLETRTDTYFDLKDKRFGLKLRGSSLLELKVLQSTDPTTNVEEWAKIIRTPIHAQKEVHWKQQLAPVLGRSPTTNQVLDLLSDFHPNNLIVISKKRANYPINLADYKFPPPANKGRCAAEQVDMKIDINGKTETYRSICFEGGDPSTLKSAMDLVCENIRGEYVTCGYPEFVTMINNKKDSSL